MTDELHLTRWGNEVAISQYGAVVFETAPGVDPDEAEKLGKKLIGLAIKEAAERELDRQWRELRDGASREHMSYVEAAIDMVKTIGVFTAAEAELWHRRIEKCPGHDDEGGRSWCAYCGNMPQPPETDDHG